MPWTAAPFSITGQKRASPKYEADFVVAKAAANRWPWWIGGVFVDAQDHVLIRIGRT
jgi:hypothetical protein